ncbi:hypothetical protein [Methylobrevis pamukkalensis]|nr:hypothetical protein [Methylobrevis pamukkalensis]
MTAILVAGLSLSACASVIRGTTEDVRVEVDPPDAAIASSTGLACAGIPCVMNVSRKTEFSVTATKTGYRSETVEVKTGISGAAWPALPATSSSAA